MIVIGFIPLVLILITVAYIVSRNRKSEVKKDEKDEKMEDGR